MKVEKRPNFRGVSSPVPLERGLAIGDRRQRALGLGLRGLRRVDGLLGFGRRQPALRRALRELVQLLTQRAVVVEHRQELPGF